ncbi:MAG: hypothetical protein EHM35_00860 [Planctomycetaceae bacterium]|nr:MAG: hypothetical protein EHM35_00860 [Planctomycetaceae bacterium]
MKYYTALRFKERPDLHATLTYYGEGRPGDIATVTDFIAAKIKQQQPRQFVLDLDRQITVGWKSPVKALSTGQQFPPWIVAFVPSDWLPHVTCPDDPMQLTVTAIAVMSKKTELFRWELP